MKIIKDPIHGNVELTLLESIILRNELLNRLHHVKQTSLAYLVFPSAQHSRFSHSLGVMHVASLMFKYALSNADKEVLENYLSYARDRVFNLIFKSLDEIDHKDKPYVMRFGKEEFVNSLEDLFLRKFIGKSFSHSFSIYFEKEERDKMFTYFILLQSIRLAGLFHDIGHLPFSHLFELALDNFLTGITQTNGITQNTKKFQAIKVLEENGFLEKKRKLLLSFQ